MKIAVVGSGISGLTCAYYLSPKAEVHVFEANSYIGGHTNTIDVEVSSGRYAVDTGFIVFNDRTYPRFIKLMNELKVPSQPSSMSFSVKVEKNGLEYNGTSINSLFAQRSNVLKPSFYRMVLDILRFNKEVVADLNEGKLSTETTLGTYLVDRKYSHEFIEHYIIPMGAAIWSAGVAMMREFPLAYFVRFFKNHGMLSVDDRPQWRVIRNGSKFYIPPLVKAFKDNIHLNSPVRSIRRVDASVILNIDRNGAVEETHFDHVILAGHADQSLALLADATTQERKVLGAFPYQENNTVLHTDTSVLPKRKLAWASWNYLVPAQENDAVAVTYDMNILQTLDSPETFLVSLNMEDRIDPRKIIKKIRYHHPVYSVSGVQAQQQWNTISGTGNTHFCGAYWGYGFHEDGVASAHKVCESFGVRP